MLELILADVVNNNPGFPLEPGIISCIVRIFNSWAMAGAVVEIERPNIAGTGRQINKAGHRDSRHLYK